MVFFASLVALAAAPQYDEPVFASADLTSASLYSALHAPPPPPASIQSYDRGTSYWRIGAGLTSTNDSQGLSDDLSFDEGVAVSIGWGRRSAPFGEACWALELEAFYSDQDVDATGLTTATSDVSVLALFGNAIYNFPLGQSFEGYVGGGIGLAGVTVGDFSDDLSDFDEDDGPYFSWQGKAGIHLLSGQSSELGIGYRFLNVDDTEIDDGSSSFDLETTQHVLELSYGFAY